MNISADNLQDWLIKNDINFIKNFNLSLKSWIKAGGIINTFIQPEDINQLPVIKKLTDCVFKFSSQYFNFPIRYIEPVQYAEYTEGMYYTPHMDSGVTFECDRDISASVFLSPRNEYEGGNLSLMYPTGWEEADEQQGSMVLFPSMLTHKVEKVKKGKRSSLVLWCRR